MTLLLIALDDVQPGKRIKYSVGMMMRLRPGGQDPCGRRFIQVTASAIGGRHSQSEQKLVEPPRWQDWTVKPQMRAVGKARQPRHSRVHPQLTSHARSVDHASVAIAEWCHVGRRWRVPEPADVNRAVLADASWRAVTIRHCWKAITWPRA
jgi:hypothetical protein